MEWKRTWSYLPIDYNTTLGILENSTERIYMKNNLSGRRVKVCFSNLYGAERLAMEQVVIGKRVAGEDVGEWKSITAKGQEQILVQPGEEFESDVVELSVQPGEELVVSIFFKEQNKIQSVCANWAGGRWYTEYKEDGNFCMEGFVNGKASKDMLPTVDEDVNKPHICVGISEVWVETEEDVKTIALFGDSITHMSYYSDALGEILDEKYPGKVAFLNCGLGGNRVLRDATYVPEIPGDGKCFGIAALARFENNVYAKDTPEAVIILEGVNDLMHPYVFRYPDEIVTAEELKEGLQQLVEMGKAHGSVVYTGTIMPFWATEEVMKEAEGIEEAEAVRQQVNQWIRSQNIADGVIDFDKAIRSEADEKYMRDETHIGDGLHPNTEGGSCMARLVPVEEIYNSASEV